MPNAKCRPSQSSLTTTITNNYTVSAHFPNVLAQRHIFGRCATRGAMTPKFKLGRDFCTVHLPPNFNVKFRNPLFWYKVQCPSHDYIL